MPRRLFVFCSALFIVAVTHAHACTVDDVELKSWTWTRDAGWFVISGEVVNHCADAVGVQLELALRDASGQTVSVEHVWPAKTRNIAAGASYAFKTETRGYATAKDVRVRVVDVRQWP